MPRIAACLYVRNAECDIQEWIAYHRVIGIKDFLIYDNGSTDATVARVKAMAPVAGVRLIPWGQATGPGAQGEAYVDCIQRFCRKFEWIIFLDVDEFLVSVGGKQINSLLKDRFFHTAVAFNWACFGSSGHVEAPKELTTEAFTYRSNEGFPPNRHTKLMIRPEFAINYINPHFFSMEGSMVRVDGRPVDWEGITKSVDLSGWHINHYFIRSRIQWKAKLARGYRDTKRDEDIFGAYDRNEVFDVTAASRSNSVRALLKQVVSHLPDSGST